VTVRLKVFLETFQYLHPSYDIIFADGESRRSDRRSSEPPLPRDRDRVHQQVVEAGQEDRSRIPRQTNRIRNALKVKLTLFNNGVIH